MALKIVEQVGRSDVGRQREANEDSYYEPADGPVFAVADGMGGAQAGEVASKIAVETFEEERDAEAPPEKQLEGIARKANKRIYELAQQDESRRGMGTTLTSVFVRGQEVSIGHVGDSRAYRLRDGELERLTRDHSLVAELERTGQISAETAEHHPQRSIITRALGPEPDVQVDTHTHAARAGDVYLLCSDGLTSMLSEEEVGAILRREGSLDETAEELIRAANQSGGKDNITVVLFRLGEGEGEATERAEETTIAGAVKATDVEAAAQPTKEAPPKLEPLPPETKPSAPPRAVARGRGARRALKVGLGAVVVVGVLVGLYAASRQVYFLGTNDDGLVTLYRGLPYELPLGLDLYEQEYASGVPVRAIPRSRRSRVLDHEWRGRDDAVDLVRALEQGRLEQ